MSVSFTTAKALKEAGFPQTLEHGDRYYYIGRKGLWLVDSVLRVSTLAPDLILLAPGLERLFRELPKKIVYFESDLEWDKKLGTDKSYASILRLERCGDASWRAEYVDYTGGSERPHFSARHKIPEEALAALYLDPKKPEKV